MTQEQPLQEQPTAPPQDKQPDEKSSNEQQRDNNSVSLWNSRYRRAKKRWEEDFKTMRELMNFAAGIQWRGQKTKKTERYIANITNREVNSKVAQLYARNPTAEYQRRPRLDFQLYDGKLEDLMPIVQSAMMHPIGLAGLPPQQGALLADFAHGMTERQMIDKIGKTLEILFQYQLDEQNEEQGEFKIQMKALVRRVITAKVGYCRVLFKRDVDTLIVTSGVANTMVNRVQQAKALLEKAEKGEIDETSPHLQTLQSLFASLSIDAQQKLQSPVVSERLVFDFLPATSVIPDTQCRALKGFIGARYLFIEYKLPLNDVNAIFETDIKISAGAKQYVAGQEKTQQSPNDQRKDEQDVMVCLVEILDKRTKTKAFFVDGYKSWVQKPDLLETEVQGFWDLAALTFNDVEVEEGQEATIFPPSDVELMKPMQMEWNRTRDELKKHRKANAPGYLCAKGLLTAEDKDRIENAPSNAVTELQGVPAGMDLSRVFVPRANVPIQPELYDTNPLIQDIQLTVGSQQENLGQVNPKGTATGQTIAEQSRMTVTTSNIDDLDDFLSTLARIAGQLLLKEMQVDTVKRIVGPGAVWPMQPQTREDFCNQIYLVTKAASSGRPNRAIDLRNWQIVDPILQQTGANPMFRVREILRRLDDQLDPEQAFPLIPPQQAQPQAPSGGQHQPGEQEQHEPGVNQPPKQGRPGPGKTGQRQPTPVTA